MSTETFRALVLDRAADELTVAVRMLPIDALPPGAVDVAVEHSSVNYKDALILAERGYRAASYPMVPGIDLAGTVLASTATAFARGDRVLLNGAGLGETRWGGYAERARVDAESLVQVPARFSTHDAMAIGTAGLAAALAVLDLEGAGVTPASGPVLVTGAAGGVGSLATALLAARRFHVVASAGHVPSHAALRAAGAAETIGRLPEPDAERSLLPERWGAAIDTVGGATLARLLSEVRYGGAVAATGFAAGLTVPLHLAPLLVRGVRLLGVNTSRCPVERRRAAWALLAESLPDRALQDGVTTIGLDQVADAARALLAGQARGRVVVRTTG